jgi:hypothetical protein
LIFVALVEGLRFLWAHRRARSAYARWRLGTLYGSFELPSGEVALGKDDITGVRQRSIKSLLRALWSDRRGAVRYLLWRRGMRKWAC